MAEPALHRTPSSSRTVAPAAGSADPTATATAPPRPVLEAYGLSVHSRERTILRSIDLVVEPNRVLGIIGPSGVGKSTLLRCLNRMTDLIPGLRVTGEVLWHGRSIHDRGIDPDALRARVGMIFQQPVVFPGSILANIVFGARRVLGLGKRRWHETAERVLREVSLWDEVHDRLDQAANELSVGQQQRLCLARTLALDPEVVLMDEPTSALDPASTEAIEHLIQRLRQTRSVVLVTHDLDQARRVTDAVACLCLQDGAGQLVEQACCAEVFANPDCRAVAEDIADPNPSIHGPATHNQGARPS